MSALKADTLQAIKHHKKVDPIENAGEADSPPTSIFSVSRNWRRSQHRAWPDNSISILRSLGIELWRNTLA